MAQDFGVQIEPQTAGWTDARTRRQGTRNSVELYSESRRYGGNLVPSSLYARHAGSVRYRVVGDKY